MKVDWRRVADEKPPKDTQLWLYVNALAHPGYWIPGYGWWNSDMGHYVTGVTHWAPFEYPEPPEAPETVFTEPLKGAGDD